IDAQTLKQEKRHGITFGLFTCLIPLLLGTLVNHYILNFSPLTSILLATTYSAHTLMSYPIVSKMGITNTRSSAIVVAGTVVTVTISLLLLALTTSLASGGVDWSMILRLCLGIPISIVIICWLFPIMIRHFLRRFNSTVTQYLFVLWLMLVAAILVTLSGLEGVLGAFFAGLVIGRFVPIESPLMNRIKFVGNALFIPFFLIGIGMQVDMMAFFSSTHCSILALVMTLTALSTKWLSAWATGRMFHFNKDERNLCFGLTSGKASATLAVIMIGYGLNLWDYSVINAVVVMVIIVCTVSSIVTERSARNIAHQMALQKNITEQNSINNVKVMVPVSNSDTLHGLLELALGLKTKSLYALQVVRENTPETQLRATTIMSQAHQYISQHNANLTALFRNDASAANGIVEAVRSEGITELCLGIHQKSGFADSLWGGVLRQVEQECNCAMWVYKSTKPLTEITSIVVAVTPKAERETGFLAWLDRTRCLASKYNIAIKFLANEDAIDTIRQIPTTCTEYFEACNIWHNFANIASTLNNNDLFITVTARENTLSYVPTQRDLPKLLHNAFQNNSWIVLYPAQ
ncbi:MAG: cation:proton antiporter, partial [Bacteroidales bacterium]|nr:cation:proton antiporter [Bacteroidales bacterium]